jgi:spore germination cell wall hydrolase CwlJ-like protein
VTHFHNTSVTPDWAAEKTFAGQIGDHLFYY